MVSQASMGALFLYLVASAPEPAPVVRYELTAALDPQEKLVRGEGRVRFTNTSPGPVSELAWHLYLNAFRNDLSTFMRESNGGQLRGDRFDRGAWGWIELDRLAVKTATESISILEGRRFEHPDDDNADDRTVLYTPLPRALGPGESLELELSFRSKLPKVFARSGHAGGFFMVAQWFPKLGVLEADPDGGPPRWNCHQYHASTEFFADYGEYAVTIETPADFVVGATGKLAAERLDGERARRTFVADRVHDFAFAADRRFVDRIRGFDPLNEVLPEETKEVAALLGLPESELGLSPVSVRLLLQPEHQMFEERYFAAAFAGLKWFGLLYGAYPYETLTIIDGPRGAGGAMGMEYPTLFAGGVRWPSSERGPSPELVTVHEFGHQFWYGLVGSNEFEAAWLDEGLNTYSTGKVLDRVHGPFLFAPRLLGIPMDPWFPGAELDQQATHALGVIAGANHDPIAQAAWRFRSFGSYAGNSYAKMALLLRDLEAKLGEATVARALREFQRRYRFRHPGPKDFTATFEEVAGRSLADYWAGSLFGAGALDYAVTRLESKKEPVPAGVFDGETVEVEAAREASEAEDGPARYETTVELERVGPVVRPVQVELAFEDGSRSRRAWDGAGRWVRFRLLGPSRAAEARLYPDGDERLDVNPANDSRRVEKSARAGVVWASHGLFLMHLVLQFLGGLL